jgi:hypothetical protein
MAFQKLETRLPATTEAGTKVPISRPAQGTSASQSSFGQVPIAGLGLAPHGGMSNLTCATFGDLG